MMVVTEIRKFGAMIYKIKTCKSSITAVKFVSTIELFID